MTSASAPRVSVRAPSSPGTISHRAPRLGSAKRSMDVAQRLEEQVAGGDEAAADDHALRVEEVAQARHGAADGGAGVGDRARAAEVAFLARSRTRTRSRSGALEAAQRVEDRPASRRASPGSRGCRSGRSASASRITWPISPAVPSRRGRVAVVHAGRRRCQWRA